MVDMVKEHIQQSVDGSLFLLDIDPVRLFYHLYLHHERNTACLPPSIEI